MKLLLFALPLLAADTAELKRWFEYDANAPLEIQAKLLYERDGVRAYDLTYASPKGGRVTAYLVEPAARNGPRAGIVFGHWGAGTRTEFLPEAELYAQAGAAAIMIDYPWVRPQPWRNPVNNWKEPEKDVAAIVQAAVDLRRAIDVLLTRPGVDSKRIGYAGHSWGAQFGAILAAVDDRVRAAVLIGGTPDSDAILAAGPDPDLVAFRKEMGAALSKYLETMRPLAAVKYVPHAAPTPLLFQFARYERWFNESAMQRYYAAASEPKQALWYDTGHDLNDPRALADRARWLAPKLGLAPVVPLIKKRLGQ